MDDALVSSMVYRPSSAPLAMDDRQREEEGAPAVDRALDADRAAVLLDDPLDDRQPQPGALTIGVLGRAGTVERVEDVWHVVRRDADAAVLDLHGHNMVARHRRDPDR